MPTPFKLKWNFDVSTFRLLGRELITDRITALFELVKNCYDANADTTTLIFHNTDSLTDDSSVTIKDDGLGMSLNDIRYKWMVVGTNSKRKERTSPAPYNRTVVGEKGVGRFAVEKLGSKVTIETTQKGTSRKITLELDWTSYETLSNTQNNPDGRKPTYFTDVENNCWISTCPLEEQGTTIKIFFKRADQLWSEADIDRAYSELSKLVSPLYKPTYPFKIVICSNIYSKYQKTEVINNFAIDTKHHYVLNCVKDRGQLVQQQLFFNSESGEVIIRNTDICSFGPVSMDFYYLDKADIRKYKTAYKGSRIDGIIIYRDGIITTPFAETEEKSDKKRDILGIDKRRYSGFFDKISSNNLVGFLNITKEGNPLIKDATNRQDFIDCTEYRELKAFIIDQIEVIERYLSYWKKKDSEASINKLQVANNQLSRISDTLNEIYDDVSPEVRTQLKKIDRRTKAVQRDISKGIRHVEQLKQESERKEDLFLSLLSLQDYAAELSHMVKTTIGNIKSMAEFFKTDFPNPEYDDIFKDYATSIYNEMEKLSIGVKFMLSYATSGSDFETFEVFSLIKYLFERIYKDRFDRAGIHTILEYSQELKITHNKKFFEDIFENLISNSVKALKNTSDKVIKCTGTVAKDKMTIRFSDNGCGIPKNDWERIFEIFKTTTQNDGGAGIGLFTVRKRIEALQGEIKVVEPEYTPGATFLITLPFKH
jgi:signal transduction histidine kinase